VTEGRGVPLVYVATRLFALQDRIAAAILADQISVALAKSGLDEASVFLPFRDTGQSGISSSNKARSIYEADRARLDAACLVIGLVDGMAKDDGVAMELGYAYGKGVPFVLATSDFTVQRYGARTFYCDPLVDCCAAGFVVAPPFAASAGPSEYLDEHWRALVAFGQDVGDEVVTILRGRGVPQQGCSMEEPQSPYVFVDVCGGRWFWSKFAERRFREAASAPLIFGQRWHEQCSETALAADLRTLSLSARAMLVLDGPEADAGTAFLHGIACARGIPVGILYTGPTVAEGPSGQNMPRNLMLYESASRHCTTIEEAIIFINGG